MGFGGSHSESMKICGLSVVFKQRILQVAKKKHGEVYHFGFRLAWTAGFGVFKLMDISAGKSRFDRLKDEKG